MTTFQGTIGIIGAGALGALYGARIARNGHEVKFLLRSDYDTVVRDGLQIKSPQGDFTLRPPVYKSATEMGPCDLVIIGLKTTNNHALGELLRPVVGPETVILTLQNGLGNEELIVEALVDEHPDINKRLLGCVAFLCSNRVAPGVIHHVDYGHVRLAEFSGPVISRTEAICELFKEAEFGAKVHDSLMQIRWEKLVWNVPFNGLSVGAVLASSKDVVTNDPLRAVARGLMDEVIAGATADGVTIEPSFADLMMEYTDKMVPYKSSMQLDFEARSPIEVESILGEPYRRARGAGIPTPRLEMLYGIVKRADGKNREDPDF